MMATLLIRPIRIRDLASLRHLGQIRVSLAAQQALSNHVGADVLAAFPLGRRYWRAFVATLDGEPRALIELQPEPREFRWQVTRLAAGELREHETEDAYVELWTELLLAAVRAAAQSGAKRLHAIAPADGPAFEALRRASFTVYAPQTALLAHGLHRWDTDGHRVREQEDSDVWSIHQLYHLATPRPIQHAEAFTSSHWDVGRRAGWRVRGFLMEHDHDVTAYCRVMSRGRRHVLEVLTQPGEARLVEEIVPVAVGRAADPRRDVIWVGLPDYHSEYLPYLLTVGFEELGRQVRMVRYTALEAQVRQRALNVVPELGDRLPARLPSYTASKHGLDQVPTGPSVV